MDANALRCTVVSCRARAHLVCVSSLDDRGEASGARPRMDSERRPCEELSVLDVLLNSFRLPGGTGS